ncbi:uncharacterized protein TNCV_4062171 [Trichonephila clavipes]|nr:uncharacterized protein TNCV_4062171 [Trichonephila clavipes]
MNINIWCGVLVRRGREVQAQVSSSSWFKIMRSVANNSRVALQSDVKSFPLTDRFVACVCVAAVAEWYRYRIVACLVTSSSPVPLKTRRIGQRCTLNLSRAETSSRWCEVGVRRGGASSGVVHIT